MIVGGIAGTGISPIKKAAEFTWNNSIGRFTNNKIGDDGKKVIQEAWNNAVRGNLRL